MHACTRADTLKAVFRSLVLALTASGSSDDPSASDTHTLRGHVLLQEGADFLWYARTRPPSSQSPVHAMSLIISDARVYAHV